jgi:predicted porin
MKRKLFVAALTALGANAAMAQSSVTLYGLVDLEVGKYDGSNAIRMNTGATSFWGLKGSEDLGGGYKAVFQLEQQFNPNNGTFYNSSSFFSGRSTVGLEGWFGHLVVGRDVNASHYAEVSADPFGQNGLVAGYAARGGISEANGGPGQIDTVRTNNSANYAYTLGPVTVHTTRRFRATTFPIPRRSFIRIRISSSPPRTSVRSRKTLAGPIRLVSTTSVLRGYMPAMALARTLLVSRCTTRWSASTSPLAQRRRS